MGNDAVVRNVFLIQETFIGNDQGYLQAVSNRELVWRWIEENGMCLLSRTGKVSKTIGSYKALCKVWETKPILPVMIIGTENETKYYNLVKLPVQTK